jgi:hypothetical protein
MSVREPDRETGSSHTYTLGSQVHGRRCDGSREALVEPGGDEHGAATSTLCPYVRSGEGNVILLKA